MVETLVKALPKRRGKNTGQTRRKRSSAAARQERGAMAGAVQMVVWIAPEMLAEMKEEAAKFGVSLSWYCREIFKNRAKDDYLKVFPKEV